MNAALLAGIFAGYAIAVPVGVIAVLIIEAGMAGGLRRGFAAGAGAGVVGFAAGAGVAGAGVAGLAAAAGAAGSGAAWRQPSGTEVHARSTLTAPV